MAEYYPQYGTTEEKELWLTRAGTRIDALEDLPTGGGGTLTEGLEVNDNNEIVNTDDPNNRLGYALRYLHVRVSATSGGTSVVPSTVPDGDIFIGVFNSNESSAANIPGDANFIYRAFANWTTSSSLYFIPFGFNNVRFEINTPNPGSRTPITTATLIIDLEAGIGVGAQGAPGADGEDAVTPDQSIRVAPSNLSMADAYTQWDANMLDPLDWALDPDGMDFGDNTSVKALVASVRIGGNTATLANRQSYTYAWTRNGIGFTPDIDNVRTDTPFLFINVDDLVGRQDQFNCNIIST